MNEDIEAVYEGFADPDRVLDSVYYPTAKLLMDAYVDGFGKTLFGSDWSLKDTELLNRVQNNLFSFSAAKSYAEAGEIRDSVYDPKTGKIRSRNDFRRACRKIDARYNGRYLDTERNMVVTAGTQGSRWIDFENSADTHPYLEYVTARDAKVREEHRALDGVILPIDAPFWQQYYPPNGWNCRCSVQKRTEREYDRLKKRMERDENERWKMDGTEASKKAGRHVEKKFRHNVGTSYIFDKDDHPYYKAHAAARNEQLTATKHYGMKTISQIYENPGKLASYEGGIQSKEDYDRFWEKMENEHGEAGKGFTLIDRRNHASATFTREQLFEKLRDIKDLPTKKYPEPQRRWSYFDEILNVFHDPDEVWMSNQESGNRLNRQSNAKIYLRFYEDKPLVMFLDEQNEVLSFYKEQEPQNAERLRIGVLLQKKKR